MLRQPPPASAAVLRLEDAVRGHDERARRVHPNGGGVIDVDDGKFCAQRLLDLAGERLATVARDCDVEPRKRHLTLLRVVVLT
ncbi:MAG: hypothetical protein ACI9KE_003357 [Polyangiales bacterium]|jgi:hypothetical protein